MELDRFLLASPLHVRADIARQGLTRSLKCSINSIPKIPLEISHIRSVLSTYTKIQDHYLQNKLLDICETCILSATNQLQRDCLLGREIAVAALPIYGQPELLSGILVPDGARHPYMRREIVDARMLLVKASIECTPNLPEQQRWTLSDLKARRNLSLEIESKMSELLVTRGVSLLVCGGSVSASLMEKLSANNITVLKHIDDTYLERLAYSQSCRILPSLVDIFREGSLLNAAHTDELWVESHISLVGAFRTVHFGALMFSFFTTLKDLSISTILLKSAKPYFVQRTTAQIEAGVRAVLLALAEGYVVPGKGYSQLVMADAVKRHLLCPSTIDTQTTQCPADRRRHRLLKDAYTFFVQALHASAIHELNKTGLNGQQIINDSIDYSDCFEDVINRFSSTVQPLQSLQLVQEKILWLSDSVERVCTAISVSSIHVCAVEQPLNRPSNSDEEKNSIEDVLDDKINDDSLGKTPAAPFYAYPKARIGSTVMETLAERERKHAVEARFYDPVAKEKRHRAEQAAGIKPKFRTIAEQQMANQTND
eukprot:GILJ01018649.1.p1 GENE.GILJ01018649.1~~GILJ01018649.1.p1  ORF type:complete len:541 (-),score=72.11 GILJ01018649.1:35-1657(-)